ncbi:MAG: hypothetical protein M5U34_41325 [Chloroflexi bacterium]|nr:hypothetical protein [Chloroflexota bacterium]
MPLPHIRDLIDDHFSEEELQLLAFDLKIPYKNLPGTIPRIKAQSLVAQCVQANRLPELLTRCRELKPLVAWPDPVPEQEADP